jgi:hypothetical protein
MGTGSEFSRISQHLQQEPWVSTAYQRCFRGPRLEATDLFYRLANNSPLAAQQHQLRYLCAARRRRLQSAKPRCVCVHNGRARQRNHVIAPKVVGFLPRYTRQALPRTGDQKWITARRRSYFSRIGHRSSTNGLIFAAPATRHRFSGLEHPIEAY